MADEPLTLAALAKFHREIVLPDIKRVVGAEVDGLRAEVKSRVDTLQDQVRTLEARLED